MTDRPIRPLILSSESGHSFSAEIAPRSASAPLLKFPDFPQIGLGHSLSPFYSSLAFSVSSYSIQSLECPTCVVFSRVISAYPLSFLHYLYLHNH